MINWKEIPYSHEGRWEQKYKSILNPNGKSINWPQLLSEYIIWFRIKYWKDYKDIKIGENWHKTISGIVRKINQQATVICNYFPHPDDEPLVIVAFRNWCRKNKPTNIGHIVKNRISIKNSREIVNISQYEKDIVVGVQEELDRLIKQRDIFSTVANAVETKDPKDIKFNTNQSATKDKKGSLSQLLEMEKKLNG